MKLNIDIIIKDNILNKYESLQDPKFTSKYTEKELSMWQFTYELGRFSLENGVCDTVRDSKLIQDALEIYYSTTPNAIKFTTNEWIKFLILHI